MRNNTAEEEARAFWRARARIVGTVLRQTLTTARLRLGLVLVLSGLLWYGLFRLLVEGFSFLRLTIPQPTYDDIVQAMFGVFFAALLLMLVFSAGIILYGALFHSREITLLLTLPARDERVFLHKFQEAVLLSSWGFMLLGSPMLVAYGVVVHAPWYYYALLFPFMVAFVYIPTAVGGILCLEILFRVPQKRAQVFGIAALLVIVGAIWFSWSLLTNADSNLLTPDWFLEMLGRLQLTEHKLLPSWWLSMGLLQAAHRETSECVLFLALMIANALFFRELAIHTARRVYRVAYSRLYDTPTAGRRARAGWFDQAIGGLVFFLPRTLRLFIVKDLRLFRRDPAQWSQFLVFFGLLLLYFLNVRRFSYTVHYSGWVSMVSFMNVAVVGLLMSTFTTRFVFPMISLESRRFWFLGLLPLRRDTILWSKFAFAVIGLLVPCSALILLSDTMLGVTTPLSLVHQWTCLLLCLGLSGIAVGLGARLPNLREQSPARIAAGFGGTLNLVVSTMYILVILLLSTLPSHFYLAAETARRSVSFRDGLALHRWLNVWLTGGALGSVLLAAVATIVPLWIGLRTFRRLEF